MHTSSDLYIDRVIYKDKSCDVYIYPATYHTSHFQSFFAQTAPHNCESEILNIESSLNPSLSFCNHRSEDLAFDSFMVAKKGHPDRACMSREMMPGRGTYGPYSAI